MTPGSYTNTSLTVNAEGQLTAASTGAAALPTEASLSTTSVLTTQTTTVVNGGQTVTYSGSGITVVSPPTAIVGPGLDSATGVWTAPATGLYHFDASTNVTRDTSISTNDASTLNLVLNGSTTIATQGSFGSTLAGPVIFAQLSCSVSATVYLASGATVVANVSYQTQANPSSTGVLATAAFAAYQVAT